MTPENFTYWLQGYLELSRRGTVGGNISLDSIQVKIIEEHLNLVFTKVTPDRSNPTMNELFKEAVTRPVFPKNVTERERYC